MTPRILFVLTSHGRLGDTDKTTGYYVPEAAHPWQVLTGAGYEIDFVSPRGGQPPQDGFDPADPVQQAFLTDPAVSAKLAATQRPGDIDPAAYDAILYVGGAGAMWDFPDDTTLAKIGEAIYDRGGVVAAVCHGPAGLLGITLPDGSHLVDGKQVAAFTNDEEAAVGKSEIVPFLLQTALEDRGAKHSGAANFTAHVIVDGRLVTGQNPASAAGVATAIADLLNQPR